MTLDFREAASPLEYRNLGHTGLKVSRISLGGWLNMGRQPEQTPMERVLQLAYDRGINHFDLADSYADGEAEKAFGAYILDLKRESLVIASKVALPVGDGPNDRGLSRKHITESVSHTLRNLGTDYPVSTTVIEKTLSTPL